MSCESKKIGQLARETGLSVRALRHYDAIGLLRPSERTASGHRLYTRDDVIRLQQIVSLRHLGLALEEIRAVLDGPDGSPLAVVRLHLARLHEQIRQQQRLRERLEAIAFRLEAAEPVSAEEFTRTIQEIIMAEQHFTPEQMERIRERGRELGPERIREAEAEWPRLIAEVRKKMEGGADPTDPRVQALGRRWAELVREFSGGDAGIERAVAKRYREEPELRQQTGIDPEMFQYIGRVMAAGTAAE